MFVKTRIQGICKTVALTCFPVMILFVASCSSARLAQFSQFAAAGQMYTSSLPNVLDVALKSTIEANSLELIETRKDITSPNLRANALAESDKEILRRIDAFNAIKTQTTLLGSYFTGIAALAESDAGEGLVRSTQNVADELAKVSQSAADLQIGDAPIKDVLGGVVPIVVDHFRKSKLEQVLKETAESVGRSIDIHIELLDQLSQVIRSDQEVAIGIVKLEEVDRKYVNTGELPTTWRTRRSELLLERAKLGELEEALKAAKKLKLAFVDLIENKQSSASLTLLLQDVERLISLAERISGTYTETGE